MSLSTSLAHSLFGMCPVLSDLFSLCSAFIQLSTAVPGDCGHPVALKIRAKMHRKASTAHKDFSFAFIILCLETKLG